MKKIETVAIIGLGALGTLYGHHFTKHLATENVRIVVDHERMKRYQSEGIFCNGERCDFHYVTPEQTMPAADLVIFATKYAALPEAIAAVRNQVGPTTLFISVLNGIISEEEIGAAYGMEQVVYCVGQGMDAVKFKNELTYENKGILVIGDKTPGAISPKTEAIAHFFERVELPHLVDANMMHRLWGKFMLNVGVNQTVAFYEGTYGTILTAGAPREMMIAAMQEVLALAPYEGIALTEADLDYWLSVLSTLSQEGMPSMAQDVQAKRKSELALFAGTVCALGKKHGIATPINDELFEQISAKEAHY